MRVNELIQRKATVNAEISKIAETVEKENRSISAIERENIDKFKREIADLSERIELQKSLETTEEQNAARQFNLGKDEQNAVRQFNLGKVFEAIASGREFTGLEAEINQEGKRELGQYGGISGFVLPEKYLREMTKANSNLLITKQNPNLNVVEDELILPYLNPTIYNGLDSNYDLPYADSAIATFATENTAKDVDNWSANKVTLTPEGIQYTMQHTVQSLAAISPAMQATIISKYVNAIDRGIEKKAFDIITALAAMGTGYTGTSKTLEFSGITAMEAAIAYGAAYVTSTKLRAALKGREKVTGKTIWDDFNYVNGKPAFATSFLADTHAIFGDFNKGLAIGYFGGLMFLRDNLSNKNKMLVDFQASRLVDIKIANAKAFAIVKNAI